MIKKNILLLLFFTTFYYLQAKDYNFFRFNKNSGVDYYTGKQLSNISNEDIEYSLDIIDSIKITTKSNNSISNIIYKYINGTIVSIDSNNRDGRNTVYHYSSNGYLESFDFQKRIYPQDNICLLFEDNLLIYRITIYDEENYKKIIYEKPVKNSENFYIAQTFEYFYKEKLLQKYIESYSNVKGVTYSIWSHDFYYTNNQLILHTIKANDELRWTYNLSYDNENKLIEVIYKDYKLLNNQRKIDFTHFDSHGNWLNKIEYYNDEIMYEINRVIEYKE